MSIIALYSDSAVTKYHAASA